MRIRIFLALLPSVALVNCASIVTGQSQTVSVEVPNCPAASCRLSNRDGTYFLPNTPGTVQVNRVCGDMTLQCSAPGQNDFVMTVSESIEAMAWGNILLGGIIGAGVDAFTGAACEYPTLIPVPMSCGVAETNQPNQSLFQLPENVQNAAEQLNCTQPVFVSRAPAGVDVYTSVCEGNNVIMSCDAEDCSISEFSTGAN